MRFGINSLTSNRSVSLDKSGTTEIGRMSDMVSGLAIFGTGVTIAFFHWVGTSRVLNDRLMRWVKGCVMMGDASLRYQNGKLSGPAAVCFKLSSSLNTSNSVTKGQKASEVVCLNDGAQALFSVDIWA